MLTTAHNELQIVAQSYLDENVDAAFFTARAATFVRDTRTTIRRRIRCDREAHLDSFASKIGGGRGHQSIRP